MLGRQPKRPDLGAPDTAAYDPTSYQAQITCKMAKLQDFVETHLVRSATKQQTFYNKHSEQRQFKVGDPVWLSIPTAGKLDPSGKGAGKLSRWSAPSTCKYKMVKGPELSMSIVCGIVFNQLWRKREFRMEITLHGHHHRSNIA